MHGQVNAQGQDEEEHEEKAELFHAMVLFALAVIGLMALIERIAAMIAPVLMRLFTGRGGENQPEEEAPPEWEETEEGRQTQEFPSNMGIQHSSISSQHCQEALPRSIARPKPPPAALVNRLRAQAPDLIPQDQPSSSSTTPLYILQPPQQPSQPALEQPRLVEEFLSSVIQEPVEHPEDVDWDQIGPGKGSPRPEGKGSPRPASSATSSSATMPARDHKGSPGYQSKGKGKTGKDEGKKGQKEGPAKGKAIPEEEEEEREHEA